MTNAGDEHGPGCKKLTGLSRRRFLKLAGTAVAAGTLLGAGGLSRSANAGGHVGAALLECPGPSDRSSVRRPLCR